MAIGSLYPRSAQGFLQYNNPSDNNTRGLPLELQVCIASYLNDSALNRLSLVNFGGAVIASEEFKNRHIKQITKLGFSVVQKYKALGVVGRPAGNRDHVKMDYFTVLKGRRLLVLNTLQQLYKNGITWSPESQYNPELAKIIEGMGSDVQKYQQCKDWMDRNQKELEKITMINGASVFLSKKLLLDLIPEEMRCFTKLKTLNLQGSNLRELPDIFYSFPELQECVLSLNSKLAALPLSLQNLKNLKLLAVDGTQITGQELDAVIKPLIENEDSKLKNLILDLVQLEELSVECKSKLVLQLDAISVRVPEMFSEGLRKHDENITNQVFSNILKHIPDNHSREWIMNILCRSNVLARDLHMSFQFTPYA